MKVRDVGSLVTIIVIASLVLTALGGLMDIAHTGALTKEHLWHDSIILMGLAIVLVHAV